jgi:murein DD-endopeptidase MepM/ murein hydrolase activator NlpD
MRFPVTNSGSLEEFTRLWYNAQEFGKQVSANYFHEGVDLNLRTGGDTDLNQELKAISKGEVIYYHYSKHPTTGFGRHLVIRIDGAWGTRWVHYAHCQSDGFLSAVQSVNEGQIVAKVGKSGTKVAHLHISIFKVDPGTLRDGIDTIAKTQQELNDWWENPLEFIEYWMKEETETPPNDIRLTLLDQAGIIDEGKTREAIERYNKWDQMMNDRQNLEIAHNNIVADYNSLKTRIKDAVEAVK